MDRNQLSELVRQRREEERRKKLAKVLAAGEARRAEAETARREHEQQWRAQVAAIERATRRRVKAEHEWREAIRAATYLSLREAAELAGVSHATVRRLREPPP